jgi:hypothetical protein
VEDLCNFAHIALPDDRSDLFFAKSHAHADARVGKYPIKRVSLIDHHFSGNGSTLDLHDAR